LNAMTGDNGTSKKSRQAIVEKTYSKSNFFIVNGYSFQIIKKNIEECL
jgi:hypothetical protein